MSLIPYILNDFTRPYLDQQHGLGTSNEDIWSAYITSHSRGQHRSWKTAMSDIKPAAISAQNSFEINLDVQYFAPKEITVKVNENGFIIVEAKHDEKEDEHGYVSRHFVRRYPIPHGVNRHQITCSLSSDGILKITARELDENSVLERIIPIDETGIPSRGVQNEQFSKGEQLNIIG
ncbi:heat shock protein hsp-12.2-related [Holotrichia oblita]|uniref:Heat shock protein hsp-12.2-related n=1 Tax=Holotrichia oblita TaxID=644536 RepID=A0ACB9T872_HOLOL|nr:heat shock protein hsp-12.2-related [Holotrichia oblita]